MTNLEEPRPQRLALDGLTEAPRCMAVIEPRHTLSGCVEASIYSLPDAVILTALTHLPWQRLLPEMLPLCPLLVHGPAWMQ